MSRLAIRVSGLSKSYRLQASTGRRRYRTLREDLVTLPGKAVSMLTRRGEAKDLFWALKDVSFEVTAGQIVGIIGRNGAGKSTLLKILSRIVEPTSGEADIYGRVGSLLEVGTGFHPELTGRENIYLSGAILGLRRREVAQRFDEIVAFSEISQFIDTPCKHYSSGMYMRLAFAVAAHLEPEILIIDEVLAVGDTAFQEKCIGKIEQISHGQGRTIIFVSHNMAAIQKLCNHALVLDRGQIVHSGNVSECIQHHLRSATADSEQVVDLSGPLPGRLGDHRAKILKLALQDSAGRPGTAFAFGEPFALTIEIEAKQSLKDYIIGFSINALDGTVVACSNHYDSLPTQPLPAGRSAFSVGIENVWLSPGLYTLTVAITSGDQQGPHDYCPDCARVRIEPRLPDPCPALYPRIDNRPGITRPLLKWSKT